MYKTQSLHTVKTYRLFYYKQVWLFISLTLLIPLISWGQDNSLFAGQWRGELTQVEGGFTDEYTFELFLSVEGDSIMGRSYVQARGVEGVMTLSGPARGQTIYLQEKEIVRSRKPTNMAWCLKSMQLRLIQRGNAWWLEGPWQGISAYGVCPPGMIRLKKVIPRV